MEETCDELRAKAMASGSANANPNKVQPTSETGREEGELFSSDDEGQPVCSVATSNGTAAAPTGRISIPSADKCTQGILPGKIVSGNRSVDIRPRTSIQPNNQRSNEKNRVPFKSANPGWYGSPGDDRNLVISFSDDDSASESEIHGQEKVLQARSNTTHIVGNRRPPASSLVKSKRLRQTGGNVNKLMPKNLPLNRTFNGGANVWGAGPSSVEQKSQVRNFNALNRNLGNQERLEQNVGLNNNKLQDLRQQIALRESQLKVKVGQQNKEFNSVSCREYNAINLSNDAARKYNAASTDVGQSEAKEPEKKRLKVGGSYSTQLISDGRQQLSAAKSVLPSKKPVLEKVSMPDGNKVDLSQEGISMSRKKSRIVEWKKQNDKRVDLPSDNIPGADVNTSCNQTDRTSSRVDLCVMSHQTAPQANVTSSTLPKDRSGSESNHPCIIGGHNNPPISSINRATREENLVKSGDFHEVIFVDKALKTSVNTKYQASLNNASLWNCLGNINVSGRSDIDIQSLVEMEESLDKELEEAQDHRRICEIEERNALKAYRKAQRSLIEANGRCADLYRRREICSAQFRSFIMDDSGLLWSSRQHEHAGSGVDILNNVPEDVDMITKSHRIQLGCDGLNQTGYDSNQCANSGPRDIPYQHVNGQNLGSEPCSEPDASTSDPLPCNDKDAANGESSPSNDPDISLDEYEETFLMDHESVQHNFECRQKEQNFEGIKKDANKESNKKNSVDGAQDSLLLEATLRSELFARLGMRTLSKNGGSCYNVEPAVEQGAESDVGSENGSVPFSEAEKNQQEDFGGTDRPQRSVSQAPVEIEEQCPVEKSSLKSHSVTDLEGNEYSLRDHLASMSVAFSVPLSLRSTFGHLKMMSPTAPIGSESRHEKYESHKFYNDEIQWSDLIANSVCEREIGSYTCDSKVDPFQPLCIYELRGKCNNDACPWQHFKDFSNGKTYQHQHDDSDSVDCQVELTLHRQKSNGAMKLSQCNDVLTPPTYLVGLDILKVDSHSYESVVASRNGQCWRKFFSISLALSSLLQKDHPADEPFLHGSDGRIEVQGSWNRQSSYFQSKNGIMNQLKQGLGVAVQTLEMALFILNQEANELEGMKKALSVLSRSLEADPTSEILWILYLLIYYSNTKSVGKDDMFSYAVKHNEESYGLWLMYINSRMHLDDRLVAYDAALSALCRRSSASGRDGMHASACILDLFLQMIDCLCMSGNVENAIRRIVGLLPAVSISDDPHCLMLSDILTCLTFSDKCVFWVCCVYLVIYRKLPDAVLLKFEFEKDLCAIEWPSVHLVDDEKHRALKLVEMGVDSVELYINNGSLESETSLRSVQLFALSHLRCMVALDGLECCRDLLDKYVKLYPSFLELVLISARIQQNDSGDLDFARFEEILNNWPKEAPGIQCIWNQYAEYALQKGKSDFAKELMVRWFSSVWKIQYLQNETLELVDGNNSCGSLELASSKSDLAVTNSNQIDVMFGFLNLSLHNLLLHDHTGARSAIDSALKAAAPENFMHCMREHAIFLLTDESHSKGDFPISCQLNILNSYLDQARSFPLSEPLSRQFISNIEKPRVQQLVCNLLSPISSDFSLVNLVLEAWYGPSLLAQKFSKPQDLVDYVEAILELVPSNYHLAFSVCKFLSRGYSHIDVSSASILFWASSVLVNAIFHAIPIAPEYIWVETAEILENIAGVEVISERFCKKALSVYPFSVKLWRCYYNLSKNTGDMSTVVEAAREKGIKLG